MRITSISLLTITAAGVAQASILKRQAPYSPSGTANEHFGEVCFTENPNDPYTPNGDISCAQMSLISYICTYGSNATWEIYNEIKNNPTRDGLDVVPPYSSPRDQQICVCESQWFNAAQGCIDCAQKHGVASAVLAPHFAPSAVTSFSSSYCAVTNTPTANFTDMIYTTLQNQGSIQGGTVTFSDPIGNKTDVSLYFTPSVTGTAAYSFYEPGATSSGGSVTSSVPIHTSNGQIVATAGANAAGSNTAGSTTAGSTTTGSTAVGSTAAGSTTAAASTATKTGGALMVTPPAEKLAIAGVLGLAAAVVAAF